MKKIFLFLFSIQVLFAQNSLPRLDILQAKGVKKISVKYQQLPSIHVQDSSLKRETEPDGRSWYAYDIFISKAGLLDSIVTHYASGETGKWLYQYDPEGSLVRFSEMTGSGIITQEEYVTQLENGYQRYRNIERSGILRESTIAPDGRVIFQRNISGRDSSVYRYDDEREIAIHRSYMRGKPNYELRYDWLMGESGPDSMFFSFLQFAPGEGRMPTHSNRFKVLDDGSLEILPHHVDRYELKELNFENRKPLFPGMSLRMGESFRGDDLVDKSEIQEIHEFTGWVRRHYYSYAYEFY